MPDTSYEFLTRFFQEHLPFLPTPNQIAAFEADLSLVSPFLMEAALIEVSAGTQGYLLIYRPNEWRPAIFKIYNRKVAEHAQLFPIFHSFETAFRSTVAITLEGHYQHSRWWRKIYEELRKGNQAKTVTAVGTVSINKRAAYRIGQIIFDLDGESFQRNVVGGLNNGYEFLECCDLGHIQQLIEEHWFLFAAKLANPSPPLTLNDFTAKFEKVRNARNDVYHHKSVARMADVVATAEDLLDRLNFCLDFVFTKISETKVSKPTFTVAAAPRHRTWQP